MFEAFWLLADKGTIGERGGSPFGRAASEFTEIEIESVSL
jgi:hypothetical protein